MEQGVNITGGPELYDIVGNRLHLGDRVAISMSKSKLVLGVINRLMKKQIGVKLEESNYSKNINIQACIKVVG